MLAITTYLGSRELPAVGGNAKAPDWISKFRSLQYRGGLTMMVEGSPGGLTFPTTLTIKPQRMGDGWTEILIHSTQHNPNGMPPTEGEAKGVAGLAGFTGLCIPPAALQGLRPNQVLDRDPYTQYTYSVVGQANGPGGPMMVIRETGQVHHTDVGYDLRSGMLVILNKEDHSTSPGSSVTKFQLSGQE